jgi:hypothetical protein
MRLKFAPVALFALSVAFGALSLSALPGAAWAKGAKDGEKNGEVPDAVSRQFKWEEGVVGTNDKKLDRKKIAAMQEAARKEDAKHKNEPTVKKAERPQGVGVPASSTLPTMDIEKAAPTPVKAPKAHPVAAQPKSRDSLDQLLDSESKDSGGSGRKSDGGLGKILAVGGSSSATSNDSQDSPAPKAKNKHAARRSR